MALRTIQLLPVIVGSFVAQLLLLATILTMSRSTLASFPDRELDCSGVTEEIPLEQYQWVCSIITKWDPEEFEMMKPMERWDKLEKCTCNLLHHPLAWEALTTHEVETIYYVAKKLVELKDEEFYKSEESKKDDNMVKKDNLLFKNDPNEVMYFWDRFSALLLNTKAGTKEGHELAKSFIDIYTNTYYKPESYKILFKGEGETMNFRQDLSGSCNQLYDTFGPFLVWFNNLRLLSGNPRYVYRVVAYDENLYKLMEAIKMCQYLTLAGVVIKPPQ